MKKLVLTALCLSFSVVTGAAAQSNSTTAKTFVYAKKCDAKAAGKIADYSLGQGFKFKAREISSELSQYSASSSMEDMERYASYYPTEEEWIAGNFSVTAHLGSAAVRAEDKKLIIDSFSLQVNNNASSLCQTTAYGYLYHGGKIMQGGVDWAVGGQQTVHMVLGGKPLLTQAR